LWGFVFVLYRTYHNEEHAVLKLYESAYFEDDVLSLPSSPFFLIITYFVTVALKLLNDL